MWCRKELSRTDKYLKTAVGLMETIQGNLRG